MIKKIVSGGQTGVDQAALDAAIASNVDYGGWLPAGRRTENGPLSSRYAMQEMTSGTYPDRTRKNVIDSDATLIISHGPLTGGSALTANIAKGKGKAVLHIDLARFSLKEALFITHGWLGENAPAVLNIAGPRASSDDSIYDAAFVFVTEVLNFNSR